MTALGDVLRERRETPDELEVAQGKIPIVAKIGFNDGRLELRREAGSKTNMILVMPGDLLVSGINAAKGAIAIYGAENERPAAATIHYSAYEVIAEKSDINYLWLYLRSSSFRSILLEALPGGIKTELRAKRLLPIEVPLPPLDEQRRIVARIEALASKVMKANDLVEQIVAETDAVLQSKLHDIFVTRAKQWKQSELGSLVLMDDKQVDPTLPQFCNMPHISGENMESSTCRLLPYRTAAEDGVKSGKYLFSPGTVLYSKIRPYLRKAVFVDFQGVCSADVYPIRCVNGEIDPHFLKWALIAAPFTEYANRLSGRTRMPKLNRKQLNSFVLSYPSLSEQKRISAHLDKVQAKMCEVKDVQEVRKEELNALMPSILDKAFKDEL